VSQSGAAAGALATAAAGWWLSLRGKRFAEKERKRRQLEWLQNERERESPSEQRTPAWRAGRTSSNVRQTASLLIVKTRQPPHRLTQTQRAGPSPAGVCLAFLQTPAFSVARASKRT